MSRDLRLPVGFEPVAKPVRRRRKTKRKPTATHSTLPKSLGYRTLCGRDGRAGKVGRLDPTCRRCRATLEAARAAAA